MSVRPFIQKLGRVAKMNSHEVRVRAAQEFAKRWDVARSKVPIFSFAERRAIPFGGSGKFFFSKGEVPGILASLNANMPHALDHVVAQADRILDHHFDLLGYQDLDYGREINWHLDAVHQKLAPRVPWFRVPYLDFERVGDHKIVWELSRHQHFLTLAKAYLVTRESRYAEELFAQWYHWQEHNPYPIGINWASSLEVAFRSLSWLWVWHLLEGTDVIPTKFPIDLSRALYQNGRHIERYLSTYFAPNTHLLGEAVALFFIGMLSPGCASAQRWREAGWKIILEEARRQVLPDGMHFEQSTYYHCYALDFFLHARLLADANGIVIPEVFDETIERMLEALCTLSESVPQFGDDDGGRVFDPRRNDRNHIFDPLATGALLFHRSDFKSAAGGPREEMAWLLGASAATTFNALPNNRHSLGSMALQAAGIYVMSESDSRQHLVIDAGKQGPGWAGHGHADALSVQVSIEGKAVLADPGTFTYVSAAGDRGRFRETGYHNTVQVDRVSQAEPAGPFKWTSLANGEVERWLTGRTFDLFIGSHKGYSRLKDPVLHRRYVFNLRGHFWLLRDVLEGTGVHQIDVCWNFAPGLLSTVRDGVSFCSNEGAGLTALFTSKDELDREILDGWYSPRYGSRTPSPVFRVGANVQLPAECATALLPNAHNATYLEAIPTKTNEESPLHVRGYRLSIDEKTHEVFFSDRPGSWMMAGFKSDARLVYSFRESAGDLARFIICDGAFLEYDGRPIFSSGKVVEKREWASRLVEFPLDSTATEGQLRHAPV